MLRRPSLALSPLLVALALCVGCLSGCSSMRGGQGCCPAPTACECPCPAPEPACGPCGPRPAEAKAGEAWCCVYIPPVEGTVQEQVCVKPEGTRCVYVPPTFGTRIKVVCEAPARMEEKRRPGVYAVQRRDVLVKPAGERLRTVCCPPGALAPGEKQACCVVKEEIPAVWGEECSRVCLEPERLCVEYSPPVYRCVEERYEISPGFTQKVCEPAVYETRTRTVCTQPGRWEWRKNDACVVPEPPKLQALQLEMTDANPDGTPAGIFKVGTEVRYDVLVTSDTASGSMDGLSVHFSLPPELEFVRGGGEGGVTVSGAGVTAQSTTFGLAGEKSMKLQILARVKAAPAKEMLQVTAVVKSSAGDMLATESESSTVPNVP